MKNSFGAGRSIAMIAAGALALALPLAGCGGGDETSSDTTQGTPLTQADFIAQADSICAQGDKDLEQEQQAQFGNSQPTDAEVTAFVDDTLIPNLEQQANAIDALGPPDEDIDQVNAIVDALRGGIEELQTNPDSIVDGSTAFDEANKLAQEYGLQDCGSGG